MLRIPEWVYPNSAPRTVQEMLWPYARGRRHARRRRTARSPVTSVSCSIIRSRRRSVARGCRPWTCRSASPEGPFALLRTVEMALVKARLGSGILRITVPKLPAAKGKIIELQLWSPAKPRGGL